MVQSINTVGHRKNPIVVRFVGSSGSGKTTLIERLIRELKKRGLAVGAIKHAHHGFNMDKPGKDSYRFRSAGAKAVAVASPGQAALIFDTPRPIFPVDLMKTASKDLDLILVEGFSDAKGWYFRVDANDSNKPIKKGRGFLGSITRAGANKPKEIAQLLIKKFHLKR